MLPSTSQYSRLQWLLTMAGLLLYVVDIGTDVGLALQYFRHSDFVWAGLTVAFVLAGLLGTQIFSYAWYREDITNCMTDREGNTPTLTGFTALHLFGMGMFTRYYYLLTGGYRAVWTTASDNAEEEKGEVHPALFGQATDLSMLKLFEAFLESVPQLLLQLYIIMLGHEERSVIQYISMAFSLFNVAWTLVDYRRCLRRSLPLFQTTPSCFPTVVYLLYKLFTITAHVLGYGLLLILSPYSTVGLASIWLLGTVWAHFLRTDFCKRRILEWLYRAIIGFILTFTFFNVKGHNTKAAMSLYYFFHGLVNIAAPVLLVLLKRETQAARYFLPVASVIYGGTVSGLACLTAYYTFLHPRETSREADELDGRGNRTDGELRIRKFLWP
ncbi:XK-related protein 9 [Lampris incognitus]|uniref:XK-related protein 9 n=1 Tax=Lampris incognitus TaxID=2546036 RepID=UPI0024B48638|nr:XK-related protein 9 [Lampris incognitus]